MNLSLATMDDYDYVKGMAVEFSTQYPFKTTISETKLDMLLLSIIGGDKNKSVIILANDPHPVGMLMATTSEMLFSEEKLGVELMWWVNEDHRNGTLGWELFKAFEYWAKQIGCKAVQMSSVASEYAERLNKIYARKGYQLMERAYLKELI